MNIYDISKKSGYSIATVSRVVNGKPGVSPEAKARVLAVVEELGFVPNVMAQGLGGTSLRTVGIACLDVSDLYLASAVSILEGELRREGYQSLLACTGPLAEDKRRCVAMMLARGVDAVVLIGSHFQLEDNSYILDAAAKVPVVFIGGVVEGDNICCILADDEAAVESATGRLIAGGHKNLLYLYDKTTPSGLKKREGFRRALEKAGLPVGSESELLIERDISTATAPLRGVLRQRSHTAVIASEDELAVAVLKASAAEGIRIPEKLEVIGFNNSLLALCCQPELTSIDSQVEPLCRMAVSTLFDIFQGRSFPPRVVLSMHLVERGSTRPVIE
ncbi:MAG: LacI family DNA-binding transcriptional regulator [Oscillospiraceae bacterium]